MERKRNWKLRHWILCGYLVPVVALGLSALVTVINLNTVNQKSEQVRHSDEVDKKINELAIDVQIISRATRGYLLDQSPISHETYDSAQESVQTQLTELQAIIRDSEQKQTYQNLQKVMKDYLVHGDKVMTLVDQGKTAEALNYWKKDNGRKKIEAVTAVIDRMNGREDAIVTASTKQQKEALQSLQLTVLSAAALSLLISIVLGTWIIRRSAGKMNESATAIAASTSEIATTIEQQERTATHQAASVNETTTTMDELGASSRQSAEQAEAAAAGAQQALILADRGTKAVERSLNGMATLRQKVEAIATQILRLSEQTNQIGSISGLVSDLANQTNMLALNAAVEAVRAGEHGKGFAVVAAEIRKLADQSKRSAEKINALVTDIQSAINSTVMVTDEGTKTVEEGVHIAEETAQSFNGVADAVNNVVLNSQQISLNVKQQAVAVLQVVEAMNALNVAARETAAGISQIKVGTQRLNDAAQDLKAIV